MEAAIAPTPRRNRGFDETHREMIETAVRLIADKGMEALSIAALSREMGINRTTVYYHFDSRDALLVAVKQWATEQLARGMDPALTNPERAGLINRFGLENPELMKLWIDDFISGTDIRASYSCWDSLVEGIRKHFVANGQDIDADVYCVMMLSAAIIAPRVFANSIRPHLSTDEIVALFVKEEQRTLTRDGLLD